MASTRARFTISYFTLAMSVVIAYSAALFAARRTVANDQLVARATDHADRLIATIRAARQEGRQLTQVDSSIFGQAVRATPELDRLLGPEPGVFIVYGPDSIVLYQSTLLRMMPAEDRKRIIDVGMDLTEGAVIRLLGDTVTEHYMAVVSRRPPGGIIQNLERVVAGIPNEDVQLSAELMVGTMFVLLPFVLLFSVAAGYYMAGGAFKPMRELTSQLEAITDGRSLHRRLPPDADNDELGRLTATINAMLSRLETSFAALRRFTADASHELKTPLAVLRADVERAMHPRTSRDDRMIALEESLQEVTRMSDLVDSLLTLARADEGRFELAQEPIEIEPLLRDVYETATILGETAGLSISMPAVADAVVMGERARLRQLLLNLVTNAIKYTPRGGRVELSSGMRGAGEIAISVRDTGIGIAAADLPHIFDRFWRADRARSRAAERSGFGLGLAISQYIAQAHGGTLMAQSRLGRGTLFTVVLPVAGTHAADTAIAPGESAAPVDSNSDFTDS